MAAPFEDWYKNLPIITKTYMTACVATTIAVYLDIVTPLDIYLNFNLIFKKFQFWRLITNFFFFDYIGINFLFHMYFLVRHSQLLEEGSFRGRTADYFIMLLFGGTSLILINYAIVAFNWSGFIPNIIFLAPSLAFMVVYVWSRRNPHITLSFLGLFNFPAPYLAWVILGFGMLLGQSPAYDLLGIVVGHIYYFIEDVYPQTSGGRRILRTPEFLRSMFEGDQQRPREIPINNDPDHVQ